MTDDRDKEELYRRLAQARQIIEEPFDPLTKDRIEALILELEEQLAIVELMDTDAPEPIKPSPKCPQDGNDGHR